MHKTIQYSLVLAIMFIFVAVSMGQDAFDQTVAQIKALETELEERQQRVERGVSEFQESHKLNAPKDMFESDADYAERIRQLVLIVSQRRDNLQEKYLGSIQSQIARLYRRIFSTNDVTITLGQYDANNEFFLITFAFQNQRIERRFDIKKDDARNLYHNWDKVIKIGYLSIDPEYRRTLAMVKLKNPVLLQEFKFEFAEVSDVGDNDSVTFNRSWKDFTPDNTFISYLKFIRMKVNDGSISNSAPMLYEFLEDLANIMNKYSQHHQIPSRTIPAERVQGYIRTIIRSAKEIKAGVKNGHPNMQSLLGRAELIVSNDQGEYFSPRLMGYALALSPSRKYFATGHTLLNHSGIALWEVSSGTKVGQVAHGDTVNAVRFSPDGQYLAIGGDDKAITFYRIPKNLTFGDKITKEKVIQISNEVKDLTWSTYGNLISDGKKVYRTLLQPEIYDIEKPVKPVVYDKP